MRRRLLAAGVRAVVFGTALGIGGCAYPISAERAPRADLPHALNRGAAALPRGPTRIAQQPKIVPVSHTEPAPPPDRAGVDDLVALAIARNPRLAKATFTIDAARGRHIQAGLYPNPELAINGRDRRPHGASWASYNSRN